MISSLPHITLLSQTFTILDFRGRKPPLVLVVFVFKIKTHIQKYKHRYRKIGQAFTIDDLMLLLMLNNFTVKMGWGWGNTK
jgi:hypothetical protein